LISPEQLEQRLNVVAGASEGRAVSGTGLAAGLRYETISAPTRESTNTKPDAQEKTRPGPR
jgi:hypothetical protein